MHAWAMHDKIARKWQTGGQEGRKEGQEEGEGAGN